MARFTAENTAIAEDVIARYPVRKSALIPLLHLAQEQDGHVTDDAMAHIAELVGVTPAEVLGTCSFYEMFKREPVGDYVVNVCTNISCMLLGGEELLHHLEHRLGIKPGDTTPDGKFTLEDVECIAACTEAPCLQVNYRYFHRISNDEVDVLIDDLRAGKRAHEVPRHGTLSRVRQQLPDTRAGVAPPDRNVEPAWLARNNETAPETSS
jgi:NADH-quinone oxidoreductase subunit E